MLAIVVSIAFTACGKKQARRAPVQPPQVAAKPGTTERGDATWYGEPYHGRRTSSGEVFDMEQLTAAHRTLPFQTWVEVTNLNNQKKVEVRITDRGPFVDGRIIDLSRAAAREIDMLRAGVVPVELRVIEPPVRSATPGPTSVPSPATPGEPVPAKGTYSVQVGAFRDRERAEALAASLLLPDVQVVNWQSEGGLWRVWVGKNLSQQAANTLMRDLQATIKEAFIVQAR